VLWNIAGTIEFERIILGCIIIRVTSGMIRRPHSRGSASGHDQTREINMQTVIRTYSGKGAKELFNALEQHKADLETVMRPIKGFVSYTAARSSDGGFTVTVCQDKAGADESVRRARDWVAKNAGSTGAVTPNVLEGSVIIHAS
jgi:hypothetical protein